MAPPGIIGSPGTEPEQPPGQGPAPATPFVAIPSTTPATPVAAPAVAPGQALGTATVTVRDGAAFVEVDGHRGRLTPADVTRLGALTAVGDLQESVGAELHDAIQAARANEAALLALPNVVSVRAGFKFDRGRITKTPAVVVAVDRRLPGQSLHAGIPKDVDGIPVDVAIADPLDRLRRGGGPEAASLVPVPTLLIEQVQAASDDMLEAVRPTTYLPPAGASLPAVTGPMTITCHVSPDAGWAVLRPFLVATRTAITLGMYDFSAPHIYRTARGLLRWSDVRWRQTLDFGTDLPTSEDSDSNKAEDKPEEWINRGLARAGGDRFETAFARTGAGKTFASAYHIKVAVRDDEAIWLSSGNWQSSNQPAIDFLAPDADLRQIKDYNRDWHVVIESRELAAVYHAYLDGDFVTASSGDEAAAVPGPAGPDLLAPVDEEEEKAAVELQAFPPLRLTFDAAHPLTVQPILTPDNYLDVVLELLRKKPVSRLYFQNQSLSPSLSATPRYRELIRLLADYSRDDNLDVRIIFRNIGPMRKKLDSIQLAKFQMNRVRMQQGCHTKGIVVDGKTVLLGSHNWTNEGVEANRDASILIHDPQVAEYYERVFLHDWDKLARPTIKEEAQPVPAGPHDELAAVEAEPSGARVIPWSEWVDE